MKNIALLSLIASLSLATFGNINLGSNAGIHSSENVNSIAIGENAAYAAQKNEGVIAIGNGATAGAKNLKNVVALGSYELAGVDGLEDAVSINNQQLFISKQLNAFAFNPLKEDYIGKSPLWYLDGVLHFNAKKIYGLSAMEKAREGFDLYLSEGGDDNNDGKTPQTAKRTIMGCYLAFTNTTAKICVFAGDYAPISNERPGLDTSELSILDPNGNKFTFVAVEGKEKTSITGIFENDSGYSDGFYHTLAFQSGPQTFENFTIRNLSSWRQGESIGASTRSSPMISCCVFRNCDIISKTTSFGYYYGGLNSCEFFNCSIKIDKIALMPAATVKKSPFFFGGEIYDSIIEIKEAPTADSNFFSFFEKTVAERSLFILPPVTTKNGSSPEKDGSKEYFYHCTFVWGVDAGDVGAIRVNPSRANNCYFCIGENWESLTEIYTSNGNVCAPSWTNNYLNADYISASVESPAVRADGRKDAGWKDSGLALEKSMNTRADIRIENGNLVVYQGGAIVGRIPFEAVAMAASAPQTTAQPTETEEPNEPKRLDETAVLMCYPEFDGESKSKE